MARLGYDEFSKALRHGRGAALMHVHAYGLDGVEDLVRIVCLENQAYDAQCEGHRASWLYEMFKNNITAYSQFSESIVAALLSGADDRNTGQVCALAGLMGKNGDNVAASALRDFVWSQPHTCDGISGSTAIVSLDGIPAVIEIARRLGRYVQENPEEYVDSLRYLTENNLIFDDAFAELKRLSSDDSAIAAYVAKQQLQLDEEKQDEAETDEQREARKESYREEVRRNYSVERILAAASLHQSESRGLYLRFGRWARDEDLDRILQQINVETDPEACLRLLWVFRSAELPRMDARIWALAKDSPTELRSAAVRALAFLDDPRVGELGRQRLSDGTFCATDSEVIDLFIRNLRAGDEELILSALQNLNPTDDEVHDLGMSALDVCSHNDSPMPSGLATWIYSTNPCTICRRRAVEMLLESGNLPGAIANECLYDASNELRDLVKERASPTTGK